MIARLGAGFLLEDQIDDGGDKHQGQRWTWQASRLKPSSFLTEQKHKRPRVEPKPQVWHRIAATTSFCLGPEARG